MSRRKTNGNKRRICLHNSVQFLSGRPHPTLPKFPETLRGTVTAVGVDGIVNITSEAGDNYTLSYKKCVKT